MTEPKPLGIFADLLKWKLVSRFVVGLVVPAAAGWTEPSSTLP